MPAQVPIPKGAGEALVEKGLSIELARQYVQEFLNTSEAGKSGVWRKKNAALVSAWEAFVDKAPLWAKAQKAFQENNFEAAASALKKITIMDPEDHVAKMNLGAAYANLGDADKARKTLKSVKGTFDGDADFHVNLAQLALSAGDTDGAIEEFVLALERNPGHREAMRALVKLGVLVEIYEDPKDAASITYVRSDSVTDYLVELWDKEPRTSDYLAEQLGYHEGEGRWALVLAAAERLLQSGSGAAPPQLDRARSARIGALRALDRKAEAKEAADAYMKESPSAAVGVELARALNELGDHAGAKAAIELALTLNPGDLQALTFAFWPSDTGDLQKLHAALPRLEAFVKEHPAVAGAYRSLGRLKLLVGRPEDGIADLATAVGLAPGDDELRAEHWLELAKIQRYDEIVADVGRLGDMNKRDWRLRWNEAEAYIGLGKKTEARAVLTSINHDQTLHVDIRKRAKRAVEQLGA